MRIQKDCPMCNHDLNIDDVLIRKATSPNDEDVFEEMLVCDNCNYQEEIPND